MRWLYAFMTVMFAAGGLLAQAVLTRTAECADDRLTVTLTLSGEPLPFVCILRERVPEGWAFVSATWKGTEVRVADVDYTGEVSYLLGFTGNVEPGDFVCVFEPEESSSPTMTFALSGELVSLDEETLEEVSGSVSGHQTVIHGTATNQTFTAEELDALGKATFPKGSSYTTYTFENPENLPLLEALGIAPGVEGVGDACTVRCAEPTVRMVAFDPLLRTLEGAVLPAEGTTQIAAPDSAAFTLLASETLDGFQSLAPVTVDCPWDAAGSTFNIVYPDTQATFFRLRLSPPPSSDTTGP